MADSTVHNEGPDRRPAASGSGAEVAETLPIGDQSERTAKQGDDVWQIGPYRVLEIIGEGGMGTIYRAEQRQPVRRVVAVKVIKLGMDSKEVVARFDAERQALALMSHPNVAKVYDAGVAESGRPYFAMEYVPGVPLTEYCDQVKLATAGRLELFIVVCHAVQHAHQKGIIHRDLKPSNILVTLADGQPAPKIIDFGIAKATNGHLTQQTLFTRTGTLIGTPEYMSPEQALTSGLDVDTRTDIYSLGVILYELLTGTLPIDSKLIRSTNLATMAQTIREFEPVPPSRKLATGRRSTNAGEAGTHTPDPGKWHHADIRSLEREVRDDLDWIAIKALDKDRTRRYQSANDLAADIQRHLDHEPVLARPPSVAYRLSKFVRKHRVGVASAALVLASLVLGLGVATLGFVRARVERDEALRARSAEAAERIAAQDARRAADEHRMTAERNEKNAKREAQKSEAINQFLQEMLTSVTPDKARGDQVLVRDVLDQASARVDKGQLSEQPHTEAHIRSTLGNTYRLLGVAQSAQAHLQSALEINRRLHGPEHSTVAQNLHDLATTRWMQRDYDDAERLVRDALAMRLRLHVKPHADVATSLNNLAIVLQSKERFAEAEPIQRQALEMQQRLLGNEHADVARSLNNLAELQRRQGDLEGAERLHRDALAMRKRLLGDDHPEVAGSLNNLGLVLVARKDYVQAESMVRQALSIYRKLFDNDHADVATSLFNLGNLLNAKRDRGGAERAYREALAIQRKLPARAGPNLGRTLNSLAVLLRNNGDFAGAEPQLLEHYALLNADPQASAEHQQQAIRELVILYEAWKKPEQAEKWRARMLESISEQIDQRSLEIKNDPNEAGRYAARGYLYARLGKFTEAVADYRSALDREGGRHPWWVYEVHLSAYLGQHEAYRASCHRIARQFASSTDASVSEAAARSCLLLADSQVDMNQVQKWLDGVEARTDVQFVLTRGLAFYRRAQFDRALECLITPARDARSPAVRAAAEFLAAMAYYKSGKAGEGASALARGEETIEAKLPRPGAGDLGEVGLRDWLACQILFREAKSVGLADHSTAR